MRYYKFSYLYVNNSWLAPAYIGLDTAGTIQYLSVTSPQDDQAEITQVHGAALPGFRNGHSHAFQFGMAGQAEIHAKDAVDDFWSWREAMYSCALSYDPDQVEQIATTLYRQMVKKGYTHVAEFHYLHHDKSGNPYDNLAEMGARHIAAAASAGIKITLIPIFYQKGSFGMEPLTQQRRFISPEVTDYFDLLLSSAKAVQYYNNATLGFGVHSLRAVEAYDIIRTFQDGPVDLPFHLHAGEQLKEVKDCLDHWGMRPIEWLLKNLPVDHRFNIVHCTHMTENETVSLAKTGANAVLCPGTEGNLGDGFFSLKTYIDAGGSFSIGTDSQISLNFMEDLRWLDYAQRLITHKRNTFDNGAATLFGKAIEGGKAAMAYAPAKIKDTESESFAVGKPFDAAVYNMDSPILAQASTDNLLSAIMYTADSSDILGTLVDGKWVFRK